MTRNGNERDAQAASSSFEYAHGTVQPGKKQVEPSVIPESPHVISLPLLLQQPQSEPEWIVPNVLPAGVSLLAGTTRVDKALFANQLGLSVATGTPFLKRFSVRQGRVLYLALAESQVHVRGRAMNLLNPQHSPDAFHVAFRWSPFRQGGLADLEDTIAALEEPRLVIVDPLEFVQPLRVESSGFGHRARQGYTGETATTFFVPLRELATRYHLAILLLHHLPDDWASVRRDPLAGLSPTGLTAASACNLLLSERPHAQGCQLHLAGLHVAERRLNLTRDPITGEWQEEA